MVLCEVAERVGEHLSGAEGHRGVLTAALVAVALGFGLFKVRIRPQ